MVYRKLIKQIQAMARKMPVISITGPRQSGKTTLAGKLVKTIALTTFGNASLTINANELSAGMFMYSLIADGKEVDNKRMILTQ